MALLLHYITCPAAALSGVPELAPLFSSSWKVFPWVCWLPWQTMLLFWFFFFSALPEDHSPGHQAFQLALRRWWACQNRWFWSQQSIWRERCPAFQHGRDTSLHGTGGHFRHWQKFQWKGRSLLTADVSWEPQAWHKGQHHVCILWVLSTQGLWCKLGLLLSKTEALNSVFGPGKTHSGCSVQGADRLCCGSLPRQEPC